MNSTNNSQPGTPRLAPSPALLNDRHGDRHDRHGERQGERSSSSSHHLDRQSSQHHASQAQNYASTNGGNIHPALLAAVQQNRSNAGSPANLTRQMSNSGLSSPQLSAPYAAAALAAASPGGLAAAGGGLFGGQVGALTGSLGLPSPNSNNQQGQPAQSKYGQLLSVIEDMGKDIRPTYACSKSSAERLKRGIIHARILVRECLMEIERSSRS